MAKTKLHILMLTEYFYPHARGGSEQSAYFLAQALIRRGHQVSVLTPNYGTANHETWQSIDIYRFFIGKRLKADDATLTPFWHTNLFWFIQSAWQLFKFVSREKPNVIHIQGKYFLPAAVIIGKLTHIPVVFTARDYQIICPLGFCLWHRHNRCSLAEYINSDIPQYRKLYQSSFLLFHLRARLVSNILGWFAHHLRQIVCISQAQAKIFKTNGFSNLSVIYNTTDFSVSQNTSRKKQIMFVGRLTPGKGADLLTAIAGKLPPPYQLIVVGSGFLAASIRHNKITLFGQIDYEQVLKLYSQVKLALFPSHWPEPFGRGALEAIAAGTPVVTSNKGGLPEIVQGKYGLSVEPTPAKLAQAIDHVVAHHRRFTAAIAQDRPKLIYKFHTQPVNQYETLYYRCLA